MIPIARPCIGSDEQAAVAEVLASGILATGPKVRALEKAFAEFCNSKDAVACSSGTAGLCVAAQALDLPVGSKVLTTPFSFIATANCILYAGCQPVFADVDPRTFMLTADAVRELLEKDKEIRAIIPVHLYGQACPIHEIVDIARAHGVKVIEDCAQAHGATEYGAPVGAIGAIGVFSFYATKNMTTGEGGIITSNDTELLERCRLIIDHGARTRCQHQTLGFNYRMTSIAAAIGLCQLGRLPAWNEQRRQNASKLSSALADLPWLSIPFERPECIHVYHQYVVTTQARDRLQAHLEAAGIGSAIYYSKTIPDQPVYRSKGYTSDHLPVARRLAETVLSLPVRPSLRAEEVDAITGAVRSFVP